MTGQRLEPELLKSRVDGSAVDGVGPEFTHLSPLDAARGVYTFHEFSREQIDEAVQRAAVSQRSWIRSSDLSQRVQAVRDFLGKVAAQEESLVSLISRETGKPRDEASAEFASSIKEAYNFSEVFGDLGSQPEGESGIEYMPLGAVALITPWNFPQTLLMRKLTPALLMGNSVLIKPSELASATAIEVADLATGTLPRGLVNCLVGTGVTGSHLVEHPLVSAVSFTGSTSTGRVIAEVCARRHAKCQLEMGGSNPVVVAPDADLSLALSDVVTAAFTCAGQWCVATRRLVIHESLLDEALERLTNRVASYRVGPDGDMGPLIRPEAADRVKSVLEEYREIGCRIIEGSVQPDALSGSFAAPAVIVAPPVSSVIREEEVFGPVLAVIPYAQTSEAIAIANETKYALSASIYTRNPATAKAFLAEVEAGVVHVNLPTNHRSFGMPFSGWKSSGYGAPECGVEGLRFFSRLRTRYAA